MSSFSNKKCPKNSQASSFSHKNDTSRRYKFIPKNNPFKYFKHSYSKKFAKIMEVNGGTSVNPRKRTFAEIDENPDQSNKSLKKTHELCNSVDMDEQLTITDIIQDNASHSSAEAAQIMRKNSIQRINEIKCIRPIEFDLIASQGPSHKPTYKYGLNFKHKTHVFKFDGEGSSKKCAKSMACLKALYFLNKVPGFFQPIESTQVTCIITHEMQTFFSMSEFVDEYLQASLCPSQNDFLASEAKTFEDDMNNEDLTLKKLGTEEGEQIMTKKSVAKLSEKDSKTKEIIATKNPLIIWNHLVSNGQYVFEYVQEEGSSHAKLFKVELKLSKQTVTELKSSLVLPGNELKIDHIASESVLISSNETEVFFYGFGNSKKQAKSKAAQIALGEIFNIKLVSEENDAVSTNESMSDENKATNDSKIKDFSDNISEMIKAKYQDILQSIDGQTMNVSKDPEISASIDDLTLTSQNKLRNVFAAIVQSNGYNSSTSKIICITSGTKCINGEYMSQLGIFKTLC